MVKKKKTPKMVCNPLKKQRYRDRREAEEALAEHPVNMRRTLHAYECPAGGHWHLGRPNRKQRQQMYRDRFPHGRTLDDVMGKE